MNDYKFKTEPYKHQLEAFNLCKNEESFALFMEMGSGKSKVALDKACYQYCEGKINGVLIVAPNGVHSNWIYNEIGKHTPDYINYTAILWKRGKTFESAFEGALCEKDKLFIFAINIEALATDAGKGIVRRFMMHRNVLMIMDESSRIKTPSAMRTKAAINFGKMAKQRLIMTGTPVTQSPFDLYSQFKFLDSDILGNQTYTSFKHEYGIFSKRQNFKTGWAFEELQEYKNLDKLQKIITPYSYRVTKDECLDLPDKIYQRFQVELSKTQEKHYEELKNHLFTEIEGKEVVTPIVLTQLIKLQQIVGGFVKIDEDTVKIDDVNPKLSLLLELCEDVQGKVIIWSRFVAEIKEIVKVFETRFGTQSVVAYYGEINQAERDAAVYKFQNNSGCKFFIGNARAGGIGLTLTAATTMIYYSNDFSLETRLQSEDRAHRIGQTQHVTYIDIEALNTLDSKIIDALRSKKDIANLITGDNIKEWI